MKKYNTYKPSGVEWLGDIPEHWELTRLGKLLKPISINNRTDLPLLSITRERGIILRDLDNEEENHNFIPDDLSNYKMIKKGQFGMNKMKAWQGSYGVSDYDGIVSPAYFIFDLIKTVSPNYFHKSIRSKLYISFYGSASDGVRIGQWDLSKERMKQIPFLIPPLQEQTAIANFLDDKTTKIDQAIAIKQKQIELLKERRQILIQELVTGKKVWNGTSWAEPTDVKDSGVEWIGEIPEHWDVKRLKYVANLVSDKMLSKGNPLNYIGMENIESWTGNYISTNSETEGLANYFKQGDILFGKLRPYLAKVYLAKEEGICTTEFLVYRNNNEIFNWYLHLLMISFEFIKLIDSSTYGSKMPRANSDFIGNQLIPIPPKQEQTEISEFIELGTKKITTAISLKEQEIEKLKEYKMSLIDGVVTGKVRVPQLER
jgi:type I restriction enzyme S subunit